MLSRKVAVIGAGATTYAMHFTKSYYDLIAEAYLNAVRSIGPEFDPQKIQASWLATVMKNPIHGSAITQATGLIGIASTRVENMCVAGGDAFRNAVLGVASGAYDLVMVIGAEKMCEPDFEAGGRAAFGWPHPVADYGLSAPGILGMYGTRHMYEYGTTKEQMAMVSVKNRKHACGNKLAYFRKPIAVEDVAKSPMICWPFNLLDCCPEADGASCVILASEQVAKKYTTKPVWVRGIGMATDQQALEDKLSLSEMLPVILASRKAYEMAGIGPEDVDVAEVHDCFSITEILLYECLGFCQKGKGGQYIQDGNGYIGKKLAVNPSGGLIGKGHPLGSTGVGQICEVFWQLRGEAEGHQQENAKVGLQNNTGGMAFSCSAVNILSI